ncbi:MAG: S1-like domain-containing RNA-binding protein [Succinivibrionaceae bacterium]|nr:S1-like domain-containing RNA-binding protein [Succinivibrionaceae bacterium]
MSDSIALGKMNDLKLVRTDDKGGFLDAYSYGEVFLPLSQLPEEHPLGTIISVFCYMDDGRLTVTAKRPRALVGELAKMRVCDITEGAAFLEWGIRKDLIIPFREQVSRMKLDAEYVVYVAIDRMGRLYATQKFNKYVADIIPENSPLKVGDRVDLLAVSKTKLGIKVIVNNLFYALLPDDFSTKEIRYGMKFGGYIQSIRPDKKVGVTLHALGQEGVNNALDVVLNELKASNGFLPYHDKSNPEDIERVFKMSKGKFKKVIGGLYKNHQIEILPDGIKLIEK